MDINVKQGINQISSRYKKPELEIIDFKNDDIVSTSGCGSYRIECPDETENLYIDIV